MIQNSFYKLNVIGNGIIPYTFYTNIKLKHVPDIFCGNVLQIVPKSFPGSCSIAFDINIHLYNFGNDIKYNLWFKTVSLVQILPDSMQIFWSKINYLYL